MCNAMFRIAAALLGASLATAALAEEYTGNYVGIDEPALTLSLQQAADDTLTGTLTEDQDVVPVSLQRQDGVYAGTLGFPGMPIPITVSRDNELLVMAIGDPQAGDQLVFAPAAETSDSTVRAVSINGRRFGTDDIARAERDYGLQIPDGSYWYDPVLGAWGPAGGPTYGFLSPGLDLGGPVPANASGGGTGVFVNGRELHPYDVMALQQITGPIVPGRYFITADGLAGLEGGPPLWNLLAMAQAQGRGSNTWQSRITGASGFSDGNTGAVFLPNGGIVSYGN